MSGMTGKSALLAADCKNIDLEFGIVALLYKLCQRGGHRDSYCSDGNIWKFLCFHQILNFLNL